MKIINKFMTNRLGLHNSYYFAIKYLGRSGNEE
jgi:hypothetical protein